MSITTLSTLVDTRNVFPVLYSQMRKFILERVSVSQSYIEDKIWDRFQKGIS